LALDLSDFRFTGRQKASKVVLRALEASLDHLLVTPPSHFTPQKARGFVVGLTGLRGVLTIKILLSIGVVKGKIEKIIHSRIQSGFSRDGLHIIAF
jgi:hypothetical protein